MSRKDILRALSGKRNEYLNSAIELSGKDMAPIIFASATIAFGYPLLTDLATTLKASSLVMSPRDAKIA